jgi:hypothetical protein
MRTSRRLVTAGLSPLVAALAGVLPLAATAQVLPVPFTVTNTLDAGLGSLRQAILDANLLCPLVGGRIEFNLGTGPFLIAPSVPLPDITCAGLTIAGTGAERLNGINTSFAYGGNTCYAGLSVVADSVRITGLEVMNFVANAGIALCAPGTITIEGNRIHDNGTGVYVGSGNAKVGGTTDAERNYVYRNGTGIDVGSGASAIISGNHIGVPPDGTPMPRNYVGVYLGGNPSTVENNLVSGNSDVEIASVGIVVDDAGGSVIRGNLIGTDASGNPGLGNDTGIEVYVSANVTANTLASNGTGIHAGPGSSGTLITRNNTIGGNTEGIVVSRTSGVTVDGNALGTSARTAGDFGVSVYCSSDVAITGNTLVRHDVAGVFIGGDPCISDDVVAMAAPAGKRLAAKAMSAGNTVRGNTFSENGDAIQIGNANATAISGNTLLGNAGAGVRIFAGVDNAITDNRIADNAGKNIDLLNDALDPTLPLLNDPGDPDSGPNNGQNHPRVTGVVRQSGQTRIAYDFNSAPGDYLIEVFSNPAAGQPAGKDRIDNFQVTLTGTDVSGTRVLDRTDVDYIAMTATRLAGSLKTDTSEFSPLVQAVLGPAVGISPAGVNFGDVTTGAAVTQTITLSSLGGMPWELTGFASDDCTTRTPMCTGSAFICANNTCAPGPFATGQSCTITATFAPHTAGTANTTISVCDNTGGRQITLTGNGILPPPVTISPASFDFGAVLIGSQSPSQPFVITNPAPIDVTLSPVTASGDFSLVATTCGTTLAPGATCSADARFGPTVAGSRTGSLQVGFGASGIAVSALAGVGTAVLALDVPASIDFGVHTPGLDPVARTATLRNSGNSPVDIGGIGTAPPFALTHDCPATLAPAGACTVSLLFSSLTPGDVTGNVTILSNAIGGLQRIALSGRVAPAPIRMQPDRFDFGSLAVGRQSATQRFAIVNTAEVDVPLGTLGVTGSFVVLSSNCRASLAPRSECAADVRFTPTQPGAARGELYLPFGTGAKAVRLNSRGAKVAPAIAATAAVSGTGVDVAELEMPTLIEFGAYTRGAPAIVRTATVTSTGNAIVTIDRITTTGPFTLSHDCPLNLAPGSSCTLTIAFTSEQLGPAAGSVSIASSASGGLRMIALGALVQARATPVIHVTPVGIGFGNRMVGTQSPAMRVTIANDGGGAAVLGPITASTDYLVVSTTCGATLAPQASCFADVAMKPMGFGNRVGEVSFVSNAEGSPHRVSVNGAGCRPFSAGNNRTGAVSNCSP